MNKKKKFVIAILKNKNFFALSTSAEELSSLQTIAKNMLHLQMDSERGQVLSNAWSS